MAGNRFRQGRRHGCRVAMRPPRRLLDDLVHDPEREEVGRRQAQRLGGLRLLLGVLPEDRGAPLRRDHRVVGVFEDQQAVRDADAERAAAAALADHDAHDRDAQRRHLLDVLRDRAGLAALLGADAGKRALGVDQRDDRDAEPLGEVHLEQRLAVPLGVGAAEVRGDALLGRLALAVADDHHARAVEPRQAADDRLVVAEAAVAEELEEAAERRLDVIGRVGPPRMAGEPDAVPRRQLREDLPDQLVAQVLERADLGLDVGGRERVGGRGRELLDLRDLLLDLGDRPLEVEPVLQLVRRHPARSSRLAPPLTSARALERASLPR